MLRIVSIDNDPSIRLAVDGPLTAEKISAAAGKMLGCLLGGGWARHRILMDLGHVDYIDSSAVGWLLNCHKAMQNAGGSIVLHSIQPTVMRVLKLLKIDTIIPVVDDEQAASQALAQRVSRNAA
jgi:anti-anti-sigma factor